VIDARRRTLSNAMRSATLLSYVHPHVQSCVRDGCCDALGDDQQRTLYGYVSRLASVFWSPQDGRYSRTWLAVGRIRLPDPKTHIAGKESAHRLLFCSAVVVRCLCLEGSARRRENDSCRNASCLSRLPSYCTSALCRALAHRALASPHRY
jgi:hypothetical protein